jgi:hypothetical protein
MRPNSWVIQARAPLDEFTSVTGCDRSYGKQGRDACCDRRPWEIQALRVTINPDKLRQTSANFDKRTVPNLRIEQTRSMRCCRRIAMLGLTPSVKD